MPEAAVDEDSHSQPGKYEVWVPEHTSFSSPARDLMFSKKRDHRQFGIFVPATANTGHNLRAPQFVENIRHQSFKVTQ
jgi:hypothetical protein